MSARIWFGGFIVAVGLTCAAPASAQSPPADAVAAAKELIVVIKIDEQFKAIMPIIMQQMKPMIVQQRPQVERDFDAIMPGLLQVANARAGELSDLIAPLYARHFTAGELREMAAFYRSPTGQKALQKLPVIMQEGFAIGQKFAEGIASDLETQIKEELRKRGHKI